MGRSYTHRPPDPGSIIFMRVMAVPCLKDNFSYLVIDGTYAACVDPGEHTPVGTVIEREGITLSAIWLTHHHWDHVGGVDQLVASYPNNKIEIVAHASDRHRLPKVTHYVDDGESVSLGNLRATIIHNQVTRSARSRT